MVPKEWKIKTIGDIATVSSGGTPNRKEQAYWNGDIPWVTTAEVQFKTILDSAEKITKEGLTNSSAKLFPINTILMAMYGQGKTRGQVAKLGIEASTNQACAAIILSSDYCVDYYYQFLIYQYENIRNMSNSGSQENLSGSIVKSIPVLVPPYFEQEKIAQILSTWDQAISTTEKMLQNSQQQKKALMQQLLTGKKRLLDENGVKFSDEWQRIELGLLLDYQQPTPYLVESTAYSDSYETPVLTAGKTFILGYTNESSGIYQDQLPVIIFDDFTTDSKYVNFPFKAKSSAMKILTAKKGVSIKFVFEAMQMLQFTVGGHQRHWISIFSNLVIPLPNKKEQQQIAEVLSLADQEIETLQKKLDCLQQEKKALMQQLLTGKKRVKVAA
ncbi:restriction endonuclease subunit S [Acinetobacter pittii]|uniref:Restriction endonuclease subunit S n=2 Tax=Acinetobacter calcoaceticus/baumannii complex TaxID=909768 RepID=A0AB37TM27_ACIPI|nr:MULTISPECIES: restriction endonuclease subunit S [Acinetobacter calcoaceticus/baumannii complex]KRI40374.1 type I restriction endonuclease subunit S [Acinetobacter baumannii]MBP1488653.1 restriction endonuclease subunit S [Acinetobacter nosocomialis]RSO55708.1 restriction endonuclease subunit S [Acinetobacter pittii]RSO63431.1 restriction endonuclease subunit S [Acinetobacter pittii]